MLCQTQVRGRARAERLQGRARHVGIPTPFPTPPAPAALSYPAGRVQAGLEPSLWAAGASAWRRGGARGLYAGWGVTLLRDIPEVALSFALFELGRRTWCCTCDAGRSAAPAAGAGGAWRHWVLGGGCGAIAAAVTVPLDNIKARVQCMPASPTALGARGLRGLALAELRLAAAGILRESGPAGLLAGVGPRVAQVRATADEG